MRKLAAIAIVLMIFTFSVAGLQAQQTDTKTQTHGPMMMMGSVDCPMAANTQEMRCAMSKNGKCPMVADKCPMPSHHLSRATAPEKAGP